MSDLAAHANATASGYTRVQTDRGSGKSPRFISRYEQWLSGADGDAGFLLSAQGESDVNQATADTAALAALNGQRKLRYGAAATAGNNGKGRPMTFDK